MDQESLRYFLKNNFAARAVCKVPMNVIRKKSWERYGKSKDSKYLETLKDTHRGERCFIIGNGPSLTVGDLERLGNEVTFASNRIYKVFDNTGWRPTYYLAVDDEFIKSNMSVLKNLEIKHLFLGVDEGVDLTGFGGRATRIFEYTSFKVNKWNDFSAHISEDVASYFSVGYTVTFTAIQLAIYMGFQEIYLLGVDFNYSAVRDKKGKIHRKDNIQDYFFGEKFASTVLPYDVNLYAYQKAKEYALSHGIGIWNATRGGMLEVFDRVDLEKIIRGGGKPQSHNPHTFRSRMERKVA